MEMKTKIIAIFARFRQKEVLKMRNPNSYGSVKKLGGKRRRPFAVYITTGWEMVDGKAKQIQKPIGYYATRQEAMIALADYNKSPFDISSRNTTFGDIYEILLEEKFNKMKPSARSAYITAFKGCDSIKNIRMSELKKAHMQKIVDDNSHKSRSTLSNFAKLFNAVYKFALENDICEKNYAEFVTLQSEKETEEKVPFSREEVEILWNNIDWVCDPSKPNNIAGTKFMDAVLIHIYTGVRPQELLDIKKEDVHLNERWIDLRGTKTKSARRIVPIHKKIIPLLEKRMEDEGENLFTYDAGKPISPISYRSIFFRPMCKHFGFEHTPHECRHTFATFGAAFKLNRILLKKIIGHSSGDLTEDTYTHAFIEDLIVEIDKFNL